MTAVSAYTLLHRVSGAKSLAISPDERRAGWLYEDVRRAIDERQFTLVYQPVVRLSDRSVVSREALLRLRAPVWLPPLPTAVFVALAADWGLASALDEAVLEAAPASVSVNISASTLLDSSLMARLPAGLVTLEVNATGLAETAPVAAAIAEIRAAGIAVGLDDLGADEATLSLMAAVRFDFVKFVGGATHAAADGARGRRLVTALVTLAERGEAIAIAKSVETLPQAWLMQELGVTQGQGWLFGAPGPLDTE